MNSSGDSRNSNAAENGLLGQPNISTFDTSGMPDGFQRLLTETNQKFDQDEANINNSSTVTSSSQRRHLFTYSTNIVGSSYLGGQRDSQVQTLADTPSIDTTLAIADNYDHDFPPLGSIQRPQTIDDNNEHNRPPVGSVWRLQPNRVPVSIGSNLNHGGQQAHQFETLIDMSNIATSTANNDHVNRGNHPLESIMRAQISGQSTSAASGNGNAGGQANSQLDSLVEMLGEPQINRHSMSVAGISSSSRNNTNVGSQQESPVETSVANIVSSAANVDIFEHYHQPEDIWRPQINRNSMSIGSSNTNLGHQQGSQVETLVAENVNATANIDNFECYPQVENIFTPQDTIYSMNTGISNMNLGGQPEILADTQNLATSAGFQACLERDNVANVAGNNWNTNAPRPSLWLPQGQGHKVIDKAMIDTVQSCSHFHHPDQVLSHGLDHSFVGESQSYHPAGATSNNVRNAAPYNQPQAFHGHTFPLNVSGGINSQAIQPNFSYRPRSEFQGNRQFRHQNANPYNHLNLHPRGAFRPSRFNQDTLGPYPSVLARGAMAGNPPAFHTEMHQGHVDNVVGASWQPSLRPPLGRGTGQSRGQNQSGAVNSSGLGHARFRHQRLPAELELRGRVRPLHHPEVLTQSAVRDDNFRRDPTAIHPTVCPTSDRRRMEPPATTHEREASPYRQRCIGVNCAICKRDLSFTPSGSISQPVNPPPAAVLPCRHAFHDECLKNITPKEQDSNPPCIACALDAG